MDSTYWAILLGSAGVGVGVAAGMAHLALGRRAVTGALAGPALALLVLASGLGGASPAVAAPDAPADLTVQVRTRMYEFQVAYPQAGQSKDELVVPAGRTTRIELVALDVVHAFWLPELGVRRTVVPGAPTAVSLRPEEPGDYKLLCAEFCGPDHAAMRGRLRVLPAEQFDSWLSARSADR